MLYIRNDSVNPYYNLALEEYAHKNFKDGDYLVLWRNERTVVVGRHQNTLEEINSGEAEALGVTVVRRNTGGGAVYHDLGNLNFSFISDWNNENGLDYDRFITPVVSALRKLGVPAEKSGRNDIAAAGKKISGNAQCVIGGRILHHGTLLVNSDLDMLTRVLKVSADKISSKGIKSIRSRVANISGFLEHTPDACELIEILLNSFFGGEPIERILTQNELAEINALADEKYAAWEWNFGLSPNFNFKNAIRFPAGKIEANLEIAGGIIEKCRILGDFMSAMDIAPVEEALIGKRFGTNEIEEALSVFDASVYFGVDNSELLKCFS